MKVSALGLILLPIFLAYFLVIDSSPAAAASLRDQMIAKAKKEGQLVFMGDIASELKNLLKGFKKRYPFIRFKSLESRQSQTINRVAIESRVDKLTIDMSGMSLKNVPPLLRLNLLEKFESPHLKDFPTGSQPSNGLYVVGQVDPIPQGVYNTKLVSPEEVPKSWEDMLDPKWKGKTIVSGSRFTVPASLAWLWRKNGKMNWDRATDFFRKVKKLEPVLGGSGIRRHVARVAAGEFAFMWFPASPSVGRFKGAPLRLIGFPKMFSSYEIWVIFKNAPHPASAWLFVDYIISPEGQFDLSENVSSVLPLNRKAKTGKMGMWLETQGITLDKVDISDPVKVLKVHDEKVAKRSRDYYNKIMGYR